MRRLAVVLTVLGALSFLGGIYRVLFGRLIVGTGILGVSPETYWRGAVAFALFAIVVLMLERAQSR